MEGNYTANLSIDGVIVDAKAVTLEVEETAGVTFSHTPEEAGEYTLAIGDVDGTLVVNAPRPGEYWTIPYIVTNSTIRQLMSLQGAPPKEYSCELPQGTGMELQVSKTIVNGSRELFIEGTSFKSDPMLLENIVPNIDTEIVWGLEDDAHGVLYVEDEIGDVDISSESTAGTVPPTVYTVGDGTPDPSGSCYIHMQMEIAFDSMGMASTMPVDAYCTTGRNYNHISSPEKGIHDSEMEVYGEPYARDGGPAPYVGTPAKLVVVGSLIDQVFFGFFKVDVQFESAMEVAPVDWEQE
jgi:hypothetical protein